MKILAIAVVVALVPAVCAAQYYPQTSPYPKRPSPYGQTTPAPQSGSSYDYQSGNSYNWRRSSDGSTTVNGYNVQNGTMWNSRIQSNGNQSGTDSRGNYWNYNARSGTYYNTDGTICTGTGAARMCN